VSVTQSICLSDAEINAVQAQARVTFTDIRGNNFSVKKEVFSGALPNERPVAVHDLNGNSVSVPSSLRVDSTAASSLSSPSIEFIDIEGNSFSLPQSICEGMFFNSFHI
jgi:hypothetical protein